MIRINLLQEKKKAKRAPKGQNEVALGLLIVLVCGAGVYTLLHRPLAAEVAKQQAANAKVQKEVKELQEKTKDYEAVKKQAAAVAEQAEAIKRLNDARAVPAWFLHELGSVLTKGHDPTMTAEMRELIFGKKDPNRTYRTDWDPHRVWITKIEEKHGAFTLYGGAQADTDVTQLALRLQASEYFREVTPETGNSAEDKQTKVQYYQFKVTGKVVY